MRAVVQRCSHASVHVGRRTTGAIGAGMVALVGVGKEDGEGDAEYIASKIAGLRIFDDDAGRMNRSVVDSGGSVLCVSQFTLHGDARKGRRPSYNAAAEPETASRLFEAMCAHLRDLGVPVETGEFGAEMQVDIRGDGPVTILLDSSRTF